MIQFSTSLPACNRRVLATLDRAQRMAATRCGRAVLEMEADDTTTADIITVEFCPSARRALQEGGF